MKSKTGKQVDQANARIAAAQELVDSLTNPTKDVFANDDREFPPLEEFRPKGMVPLDCISNKPFPHWYDLLLSESDGPVIAFDAMKAEWVTVKISQVIADYHKPDHSRRLHFFFTTHSLPNVTLQTKLTANYGDTLTTTGGKP